MGTVFNIQRFCIHDGDGIRTTVFFKGCPLNCVWCHNPEGISPSASLIFRYDKCVGCKKCLSCAARSFSNGKITVNRKECILCGNCQKICPQNACELIGKEISATEIMTEVLRDRIFYESSGGGITLSGGEPSLQSDFAVQIMSLAKKENVSCAIETCGIGSREFYKRACEMNASFLYDLKCMNPQKHKELTGADNAVIIDNLLFLFERNADIVIRIPLVPNLNDSPQDLEELSEFLLKYKSKYRYAEIMPYHSLGISKYEYLGKQPHCAKENAAHSDILRWTSFFSSKGLDVRVSK